MPLTVAKFWCITHVFEFIQSFIIQSIKLSVNSPLNQFLFAFLVHYTHGK